MLGITKITDRKVADLLVTAKESYFAIARNVTLATIRREHGNPADAVATKAIITAQGTGDADLFPTLTVLPPMPSIQRPSPPTHQLQSPDADFDIPKNASEFATLRRFPTRSRVPPTAIPLWAAILKFHLQLFLTTNGKTKEDHFVRLLILPHVYLPSRVATTRVMRHLATATPFSMRTDNTPSRHDSHRTARQHDIISHRTTEAVTRLISDHKLRSANRLLHSMTDAEELTFTEKCNIFTNKVLSTPVVTQHTFPVQTLPMFSTSEVIQAASRLNRQSAQAVDGYTKDLIISAFDHDAEICAMWGEMLHWILTATMSENLRDIILLARGVAIPKPDAPGRPICISSALIKMIGLICMARDNTPPSHMQYAIGQKDGHVRIVHKIRQHTERNADAAIIRVDLSNAYGMMPRHVIHSALMFSDPALKQYYRFVYGTPSRIAIYGSSPDEHFLHPMTEGVKQGDSTSSLFFCMALDKALVAVNTALREMHIQAKVVAYMDDITVLTHAANANVATAILFEQLRRIGMKVNDDKSKILTGAVSVFNIPACDHSIPFIVLGANVANSEAASRGHEATMIQKQQKYFDILNSLPLHPHVKYTLLKICGNPRILYACTTHPPESTQQLTNFFDRHIKRAVEQIVDPSGETTLSFDQIYSQQTLAFTNYSTHRHTIYSAFRQMAINDDIETPRLALQHETTSFSAARIASQVDAQWLFFESRNAITPSQFSTALAIRLGVLPLHLNLNGYKCNCGYLYQDCDSTTSHILKCDMATPITHTTRHNMVRDAIAACARSFGVTVTCEPRFFTYNNGKQQRPDITIHSQPYTTTTDVTLVDEERDLKACEQEKSNTHKEACAKLSSIFIPFAMYTRGTLGAEAEKFIRTIAKTTIPSMQPAFVRELRHSVAVAAAKGRANAITAAVDRSRVTH